MAKYTMVIDANRLFAAIIKDSVTRKIILNPKIDFIAPDYLFYEVEKHKAILKKKSDLSESEFKIVFEELFKKITIIPKEEIMPCYKKAKKIMDKIDPDDTLFLAVALCTDNQGIWSEDKGFELQKSVKVWKTTDLMKLLKVKI